MHAEQVQARRAIEALRAGVPNKDAVLALGTNATDIVDQFRRQLETAKVGGNNGGSPSGFIIRGDFGSGKSHLLEYLQHLALDQNFVTSKVVVSRETPLYDPIKLFRVASRSAIVPNRRGPAIPQIASQLDFRSSSYVAFYKWIQQPGAPLDQRFPATVFLYERVQMDPEFLETIRSFWAGDPIRTADIKQKLRELRERVTYRVERIDARSLALQRFRFAARLMMAAGYAGWVLLLDEVELIGRYTLGQRARAYAEIARWTGNLTSEIYPGITSVLAITSDFEEAVLEARNDRDVIPGKFRASQKSSEQLIASQAEKGMTLIGKAFPLIRPSPEVVAETCDKVRSIHAKAYDWTPPPAIIDRTMTTSMREHVRTWITEWDLKRLFPDYVPDIETQKVKLNYSEDAELEAPSDADLENPVDEESTGQTA
jgi:hypothetical protein